MAQCAKCYNLVIDMFWGVIVCGGVGWWVFG